MANTLPTVVARCIGWVRLAVFLAMAGTAPTHAQDAASLRASHAVLRDALLHNQFRLPLYLRSEESPSKLQGEIYALLEQPFAIAGPALQGMNRWCDILILHQNVKSCRVSAGNAAHSLSLNIGRKFNRPLAREYPIEFRYRLVVASPEYLRVALTADQGPLGTSAYRVQVELVELDARHSFLHLSYSYAYGTLARTAMRVYLATIAKDKVGFSIVGRTANGQPAYIGSTRGVIERNTMRYYLAIQAYLGALNLPAAQQLDRRLSDWHASVERYPRQLHELQRDEYLSMKRAEIRRQQVPNAR